MYPFIQKENFVAFVFHCNFLNKVILCLSTGLLCPEGEHLDVEGNGSSLMTPAVC